MGEWPFDPLPRKHFAAISADPPWNFRGYNDDMSSRDIRRHYKTLDLAGIKALPVGNLAAKNSHLFLWVTGPHMPSAFEVIKAWGFRFSGVAFTWVKLKRSHKPQQLRLIATSDSDLHCGLGYTTRKNAEFCLLARRGTAKRVAKDVREIILSPVREHSRKPDEAYERIQRYCDGPYLDLFSRESRPGWSSWGHEMTKFNEQSVA